MARLLALLHNLVRRRGRRGAARELGIGRRTAATCVDGGELTWRLREALEGAGSAAAGRRRNDALERRVETLEKELHEGLEAIIGAVNALCDEHGLELAKIERPLGPQC